MKYYAVFAGREPGVYATWDECSAQVSKFSGARFKGYPSEEEAIRAYNEYGGGRVNKPIPVPTPASPPHGDAAAFAAQTTKAPPSSPPTARARDVLPENVVVVRTRPGPPRHRAVTRVQTEARTCANEQIPSIARPPSPSAFEAIDDAEYHVPCLVVDAACNNSRNGMGEYRGLWILTDKRRVAAFMSGPFRPTTNNVMEFMAAVEGLQLIHRQQVPRCVVYTDSRVALSWVNNMEIKALTKDTLAKINMPLLEKVAMAECWLAKHKDMKRLLRKWDTRRWGEIPADYGRK
jgi:ribonuclease HI